MTIVDPHITETDLAPYLVELNPEQRAAVLHVDGPLQIIAGAGTGKTRTLIHRLAHLIAGGMRPDRILLLTFTRRAASEMIQRVGTLATAGAVGGADAGQVWGGTFHAIANRLLRLEGGPLGLDPGFTVLDLGDATELLGLLRTEAGLGERGVRFPNANTLMSLYSRVANTQAPLSEVAERQFPWCCDHLDDIRGLFGAYAERKRHHQVLDYDDLLLWWRAALQHASVGAAVRDRFDHVLVDEYQDTNRVQDDIVHGLAGAHGGVTVVGDDAQAIYGFRAASIANMAGFAERFTFEGRPATVVTLEQNYRSTPEILAAANDALAPGREHHPKSLWSARKPGSLPRLVTCADVATEARVVAERILEHRERGATLRDQAVLFRTSHHSDRLEIELGARDIPYVKFGGLRFLEAAHVKDLVALMRVLDNPRDELAWHRVLGLLQGVGPATVRRVTDEIDPASGQALHRFVAGVSLPKACADEAAELRTAWAECLGPSPSEEPPPGAQVERLLPFYEMVLPHNHENPPSRLADLDALRLLAGEHTSRSRFLAELVLDPPVSGSDLSGPPHLDDDWLTLSTIHSAKGGEWSVVHVIHGADGNIPSEMALSDKAGLEEERRLLHVALTRAQDELEVTWPLRFHHHHPMGSDRHSYAQLSRFLQPVQHRFEVAGEGEGVTDDGAPAPVARLTDGPDPVGDLLGDLWAG